MNYLIRNEVTSRYIRGKLYVKGETFYTIERPWLNNKRGESCIPAGCCHATFIKVSPSGHYKNIYSLLNVPNRSGILMHNGNLVSHSRGCIIIGYRLGFINGEAAVLNSRTALFAFTSLMECKDFDFIIIGDQYVVNNS